jgi:hypothetical protein
MTVPTDARKRRLHYVTDDQGAKCLLIPDLYFGLLAKNSMREPGDRWLASDMHMLPEFISLIHPTNVTSSSSSLKRHTLGDLQRLIQCPRKRLTDRPSIEL